MYNWNLEDTAGYVQIYLNVDLATCLERNAQRTGLARVPDAIVNQMQEQFEPPAVDRIEWERRTSVVLTSNE